MQISENSTIYSERFVKVPCEKCEIPYAGQTWIGRPRRPTRR